MNRAKGRKSGWKGKKKSREPVRRTIAVTQYVYDYIETRRELYEKLNNKPISADDALRFMLKLSSNKPKGEIK